MRLNLQKIITPSLPTTILVYLLFVGVWMGNYWIFELSTETNSATGGVLENLLPAGLWFTGLVTCGLVIINSMIIAQMNNRYSFIRTRTFMPTFIYLILSLCLLPSYSDYTSAFGALFVLLSLYLILAMYKNKKGVEQAFLSFFSLALSTMLVPEFIVLVPILWIGFALFNCFSSRVFFASLFGLLTPWILLLSVLYFFYDQVGFPLLQYAALELVSWDEFTIPVFVYGGVILSILLVILVQIASNARKDSIQTRNFLSFFQIVLFALLLLSVIRFSNFASYLPLLACLYAILSAHVFTLLKGKFTSILFIVFCSINGLFVVYRLIFDLL